MLSHSGPPRLGTAAPSIIPCHPPPAAAGHAAHRLAEEIVTRSAADTWEKARREWELVDIWIDRDEPGVCLCGHPGIVEKCGLVNRVNGNSAVVGNVCVTRFLGLDSKPIFDGFKRVTRDPSAGLSPAAVLYAFRRGWVNDWEKGFCLDTFGKPLTPRQRAVRVGINERVARRFAGASATRHVLLARGEVDRA